MNLKQVFGMLLLIGGVGAFIYGLSIQETAEYQFVSAFGGDTSRVAILMIGGIITSVVGLLLLILGRSKEASNPTYSHPDAGKQFEESTDIQHFDDRKLTQIIDNPGLYRPDVVEASQRELQLRQKSEELLPQVREKDDDQLREMTGNPTLYNEELIRAAGIVLEERRRLWQEEQERAEQAARLEREKQAEERRLQRIAARKKRRPYVLAVLALLVLAGAGAGYYAYRQKQERLAMERRAAEERYAAELKRAEEERAAQKRWVEERRLEEEKQRREAAAQQAELNRLNADETYRHSKGIYRVGDFHKGLQGVVFQISDGGLHGKVMALKDEQMSWNDAIEKYPTNSSKRLPSVAELKTIYQNRIKLNTALVAAGGEALDMSNDYSSFHYTSSHWSHEIDEEGRTAFVVTMYSGIKRWRHCDDWAIVRPIMKF